jgi:cyanate lyase
MMVQQGAVPVRQCPSMRISAFKELACALLKRGSDAHHRQPAPTGEDDATLIHSAGEPPMDRSTVTRKIVSAKVKNQMKWSDIATRLDASKEWATAACLGQMTFSKAQAASAQELFSLTDEEAAWLQIVPYKGSLETAVPTDPLIYRWYEIVSVYGTTIKELIHEEFGDGIMSAIDFSMDIQRQADPKGDRVNVVLSGKFLPYKIY